MDSVVDHSMSDIKSKHSNMTKVKGLVQAVERSLYDAIFHGLLASQIECENILNQNLDIPFDPMNPYRPEKRLVESWTNGELSEEFYQDNPEDYPRGHPYKTAYENFQKRQEEKEKLEEIAPVVEKAEELKPETSNENTSLASMAGKKIASRRDLIA
jgi:hypothetical protein